MLTNVTLRRVEWGDCDPAGIVFNPNYFRWFDHATAMLYEAAGWPKDEMLAKFGAAGCPIVETKATFRAPCRYGDDVTIESSIQEVRRSSFAVRHLLRHGETLCVEENETRVWTVRDESGALKSAALPDELAARFRDG